MHHQVHGHGLVHELDRLPERLGEKWDSREVDVGWERAEEACQSDHADEYPFLVFGVDAVRFRGGDVLCLYLDIDVFILLRSSFFGLFSVSWDTPLTEQVLGENVPRLGPMVRVTDHVIHSFSLQMNLAITQIYTISETSPSPRVLVPAHPPQLTANFVIAAACSG